MAQPEDELDFQRVKEAASGHRRTPMSGGASKILRFVLESSEGADIEVSRRGFEIRFGWHPSRHGYLMACAPGVVSQLMRWAGINDVQGHTFAVLQGREVAPLPDWPLAWAFGDRLLWLGWSGDTLIINVREGSQATSGVEPPPLPDLARVKRDAVLHETLPCPRCQVPSGRFRCIGRDGDSVVLVCSACGRSFEHPESGLVGRILESTPGSGASAAGKNGP